MWWSIFKSILKNKWLILSCLIIAVYLMPYYLLGEETHIRVHDNLDSNIVWYKLLAESGQIFATPGSTLPNVINGLPRSALPASMDLMVWLYVWFEPITAYTINQTIMRFVAFFGMYGLLQFLFREKGDFDSPRMKWISTGISLGFALLPFWPSGALSIAGLPLALLAFLKVRKHGKRTPIGYWFIIGLLPFHSSLILTFIFFLGLMGILWLFDWMKTKQVHLFFLTAIICMGMIYLGKNYLLLAGMFMEDTFTPHRVSFDLGHNSFGDTLQLFSNNFIWGHTHDISLHQKVILPTVISAFLIAFYKKITFHSLAFVMTFNMLLSLWYAFWYWEGWRPLKDQWMLLNTFNFSRIHFLSPLLWYLAFAFALVILVKQIRWGMAVAVVLMGIQINLLFQLNEETKYQDIGTPTFEEFYSEDLFQDIKNYVGKDPSEYRVVSVGMHPTIAQYNGMYTLDTYNVTIPLSYKRQFREIIAPELEKNPRLRNYFDDWGSRLYMYVADLGKDYMFSKNSEQVIKQLKINTLALEEMGGDYVISALPIENHRHIGLELEKAFENGRSPWKIYLYKINP